MHYMSCTSLTLHALTGHAFPLNLKGGKINIYILTSIHKACCMTSFSAHGLTTVAIPHTTASDHLGHHPIFLFALRRLSRRFWPSSALPSSPLPLISIGCARPPRLFETTNTGSQHEGLPSMTASAKTNYVHFYGSF